MSTFKEIRGQLIKKYTTNPTDPLEGQMWYNNTTGSLKGRIVSEAWSSGSPTINEQKQSYGTGIQTAALLWAGRGQPPNPTLAKTEEYNGSGWTAGGVQTTARASTGGAGTQTASLMIGGALAPGPNSNAVEEYNGTGWSASPALNNAKFLNATFGTSTAAVTTGGSAAPLAFEVWNNVSWTAGPGPIGPSTRYGGAGSGTETAGLVSGGFGGGTAMNNSDEYNGTSFSSSTTLNTTRGYMGGFGIQTATVVTGGFNPPAYSAATELYDGATWTTSPATLANVAAYGGAAGTSTAGITAGFLTPSGPNSTTTNTEEYNKSSTAITAGTWSTGGVLPAVISANQGGGTQTAGISISGQITGPGSASSTATNLYDGSAWTASGALAAGASSYSGYSSQKGTQTAMLYWGGYGNPGGARSTVSSFDGSSWTAQSAFPATIIYGGGAGTLTAALAIGQSGGTGADKTFEGDASYNWTSGGDLTTGRVANATCGPQTAAITAGGIAPPPAATDATEVYNGTSWTAGGSLLTPAQTKMQCFGADSSDMLIACKNSNGTEGYDGTTWSTRPAVGTPRNDGGGCGSVGNSGLIMGGNVPGFTAATEEFAGETSAANIVTVTTS